MQQRISVTEGAGGGPVCADGACGKRLPFKQESPSLSGFQGFSHEYVPVFLAEKMYIKLQFLRGGKKFVAA